MPTYFGIFKEPRGLIRLLQFIFAIFAFATACTGGSNLSINDKNNNQIANVEWDYPYDLRDSTIDTNYTSPDAVSNSNSIKPSAEFFVFTGVTSMLLSLAFTIIYVLMNRQYHNDERIPIIDFVLTLIWTIFWIAGSSAWAQGVTDIRAQTSYDYVSDLIDVCNNATTSAICDNYDSGTYANITVSVIFGFLNFLLWVGCLWFVYKETKFFRSRQAQQHPGQNNFSNIAAPNMQQYYPSNIQEYPPQTQMPSAMNEKQ